MASRRAGAAAAILIAVSALMLLGCGGAKTLSEEETKQVLREELPYRFEFQPVEVPENADGAVGGQMYGPHNTVVRFGISLGRGGDPVSLGPTTDLADATGGESFRVTSNMMEVIDGKIEMGRGIKTGAQWRTSAKMTVAVETTLCEETEGEPCPV